MPSVVASVRLEHDGSSVAIPEPRISWTTTSDVPGWRQLAAEVCWEDGRSVRTCRLTGEKSILVAWPFSPLRPRERGTLSIRVEGKDGWSDWSSRTTVRSAFLGEGEWCAEFIGLASPGRPAQPALIRREFDLHGELARATLYATAYGAYQVELNGHAVDGQVLKPGWTPYRQRLVHESSDVTAMLHAGRNAIGATLAGGWFTERFHLFDLEGVQYGTQPSFAAQLLLEYLDGTAEWIATDQRWSVFGEGPWLSSGIYAGEQFDARRSAPGWSEPGFAEQGWQAATSSGPRCEPGPTPRTGPQVQVVERQPVAEVRTTPSGRTVLDFGQNLVGRVRIRVRGRAGTTVTLRHAEVLEAGELAVRPLRTASAADTYTLSGVGVEEWAPSFTFHGFRFVEVSGWPGPLDPDDVTAEVIGADMQRTAWFDCSNPLVNRLHENVVWSTRGNFIFLPTDCPQRDERLGWTGDLEVFARAAATLFDCHSLLDSWLLDLALEQQAAGGVPLTVPDVLRTGSVPAAVWGDVATTLPWVLFEGFGDRELLARQYPSMKAWVDQVLDLAGDRHLWMGGFQFGDWIDPDAPADNPWQAKTEADLVASAYLFRSTGILAKSAQLLGHDDDASRYADVAERVRRAWLAEYVTPSGRILSDTQTGYALAIEFGIATDELAERLGERLASITRRDGYRVRTGIVGTALLNDALTRTGHDRQAARLLLQQERPSWLYPVTMGATTVWEHWDSLLEDGSVKPGAMTSFNHCALGSVADWLHRVVGGIAPAAPGCAKLLIVPRPLPGLDWATSRRLTPYGPAACEWRRTAATIEITVTIPANASARVELPDGQAFEVLSGTHQWRVPDVAPEPPHRVGLATDAASIIDDETAYRTVLDAIAEVDQSAAAAFARRTDWTPERALFGGLNLLAPSVIRRVEGALDELNQTRGLAG